MNYFTHFPSIKYRNRYAPNILAAMRLRYDILESSTIYHPFLIAEGDRPDTIAYLYYGDSEADWLIYLANNIIDINNQWPLTSEHLTDYILKKYGTFSAANNVKHYSTKKDIPGLTQTQYDNIPDSMRKYWVWDQNKKVYHISDIGVWITPESYEALPAHERIYWEPETFYDYEFKLNESKRAIKLIDKKYKASLESALKEALNE